MCVYICVYIYIYIYIYIYQSILDIVYHLWPLTLASWPVGGMVFLNQKDIEVMTNV